MLTRITVWFDDWLKTRSGKMVPFYDYTILEEQVEDGSLHWFHEGYGRMVLYRLWKVDDDNFIAEKMGRSCRTTNSDWQKLLAEPWLALEGV